MNTVPADVAGGRIGPNAITQVAEALRARIGSSFTRSLFSEAGIDEYLAAPPESMVDEQQVIALQEALRRRAGRMPVDEINHVAGLATADYLLARRIPRPAQRLLRALPARWSASLLAAAIQRHAWTFTGSGRLRIERGPLPVFVIDDCPLCRGAKSKQACCGFFAATFERLYDRLVAPGVEVRETACMAMGADACRFELRCDPASVPVR